MGEGVDAVSKLEFGILGPFQVTRSEPLSLGGPRQRAVLALLLLNRGEVLTSDRIIDELWGESAPPTVAKAVHVYVSNLRKALGNGVLLTVSGGYVLDIEAAQVDAERFTDLVAQGREALERGYPLVAQERLNEALALWRGRPLADFSYHQFAQPEIARLEEARLAALEDRIEAHLALGEDLALVPELETHVRAHPARERLWGQLMVALYRSGRQADALERYRRARRALIDKFGIEPGRELKGLERAILTQDPALDAPTAATTGHLRRPPRAEDRATRAPESATGNERAERPDGGQQPPDGHARAGLAWRTAAGPAALRSYAADVRRAIDARWHEHRLAIAAGAALLVIAVIAVAALTSAGGSGARNPSAAVVCSSCAASISAPRSDGVYTVGQSVVTSFSCTERRQRSAIVACDDSTGTDTVSGGHGHLDTATPGPHIYAVTVIARGGAINAASISYTIVPPLSISIKTTAATALRRRTGLTLGCSVGQPGTSCHGRLVLKLRRQVHGHPVTPRIASSRYAVASGQSKLVVLRINHLGMKALRQAVFHRLQVLALATLAGSRTAEQRIWLQLG
jgi:DNA-binding SARP family transcriptional activator